MKKIFIIILFIGIVFNSFSQESLWGTNLKNDTVFTSGKSGSYLYFKKFRAPEGGFVCFDWTHFDVTNDSLWFGYSPDGVRMQPVSSGNGIALDATHKGYSATETKRMQCFDTKNMTAKYIAYRLKIGTASTDTLVIYWNK